MTTTGNGDNNSEIKEIHREIKEKDREIIDLRKTID